MLDKYTEVSSTNFSSATFTPVMVPEKKYCYLGCAGNVAKIINEFNCEVFLISAIGKKLNTIEAICKNENINIEFSVYVNGFKQSKKRYINGNQHCFRLDNCDRVDYPKYKTEIKNNFKLCIENNKIDVVVIADYQLGFCDGAKDVIKIAKSRGIKVVVDPFNGSDLSKYEGCDVLKPNKSELERLSGTKVAENQELVKCAGKVVEQIGAELIIVTLGDQGIFAYGKTGISIFVPAIKKEYLDVTGAGDTVNSIIALGMTNKLPIKDVCEIANLYASLFIKKKGTPKLYFYEVFEALDTPVELSLSDLTVLTGYLKKYEKLKVGVTTGCFDIFHTGHLMSLKHARNNCDLLVVLLNSDESVKKLKGRSRPVNSLKHRKSLLKNLSFIDLVCVFHTKDAGDVFDQIHFDVLFKGGDKDLKRLERKYPKVDVVLSDKYENISSSLIINRIKNS